MRHARQLSSFVLVLIVLTLAVWSCGEAESKIPGADAPKPVVEVLSRGSFPDDITGDFTIKVGDVTKTAKIEDPSEVVTTNIRLPAGASVGWHSHPGPVIVTVASGALTIVRASDCETFVYEKGKSFVDPGHGNVHIGFNASDSAETVLYAIYLEVPVGKGPTNPAKDPGC